jgi:GNAT superfamily N-acetyltransferase
MIGALATPLLAEINSSCLLRNCSALKEITMMAYQITLLTADDAASYQPLRLRALQEHPEAFGASYEDERQRSLVIVAERLAATPDSFMLGAWAQDALVGIVGLYRSPGIKVRHRAGVGGMYVAAEARGQGIGRALIQQLIEHAPTMTDLEEIILAVTVGNVTARALYLAAGFTPTYIEQRYIKVGESYYDLEWMSLRLVGK